MNTIRELVNEIIECDTDDVDSLMLKFILGNLSNKLIEMNRKYSMYFLSFDNIDEIINSLKVSILDYCIIRLSDRDEPVKINDDFIIKISFPSQIENQTDGYDSIDIDTIKKISTEIKEIISEIYDDGVPRVQYKINNKKCTFEERLDHIFYMTGSEYYNAKMLSDNPYQRMLDELIRSNNSIGSDNDLNYKFALNVLQDTGMTIPDILAISDDDLIKIIRRTVVDKGREIYFENFLKPQEV